MVSEHCRLAKGGHVCTMNSWATCMSQKIRQYSTIYWKGITVPLTRMLLIALSLACLGTRLEMSRQLDREHACSHPSFLRAMCGEQKSKIMLSTYCERKKNKTAHSLGRDRLFKAFRIKDKYIQRMLCKGSLRGCLHLIKLSKEKC